MKILIITNNINPNSGWGRYSSSVVNKFKKMNLDFIVVTEKGNNLNKDKVELNILCPVSFSKIINFFKNIVNIRKVSRGFDVIHAFDGWPYGVYGYFAVLGTKKKLFINGVGTYSVAPLESFLKGFLLKKAYKRSDYIFCISNYVKKRILEKIYLKKIKVVHLGATELPVLSESEIKLYKNKYNINYSVSPILLTVGAIKERKGQYDTLKASLYLKNKYPNYLYVVIGSGKDIKYVKKMREFIIENKLKDNVKIITKVNSDRELSFFYNICDIFLLNSNNDGNHFEGFGLVFLEAAQFGKPLVGSSGCGIEDAIENGYNGYLVGQKNKKDVYDAIIKIIRNKDIDFDKNSKDFYNRFSWRKTALEYVKYYY